jgi:uncharacterized protein with HEPN domain
VAFELTTIGEAVRTIQQEIQEKYPEVPLGKFKVSVIFWYMNIFAWMKKCSGKLYKMTFHD